MIRASRFVGADGAVYMDILNADAPAGSTVVMVHGGAHTGACYLGTPDGRPGWAQVLAERGHRVVVPDWPGSGRSAPVPLGELDGARVCRGLGEVLEDLGGPVVLMTHSMSGAYGWKLVETHGELIRGVVGAAPGPPGNIQPAGEVLDQGDGWVEVRGVALTWRLPLDAPFLVQGQMIHDKLFGTSTRFPMAALDTYAAALQPIAPRLIYERQNVAGSQLSVTDTARFADMPVLIVTGSDDTDHAREVDGAVADWLSGLGARVTYTFLSDVGITGNSHMLMLDDNNADIAALIADWIERLDD